jgi:hypothetical protein
MSSESDLSNFSTTSPKQRATNTTTTTSISQKASLARIVKAQATLLISNLTIDNFTRKSTEINTVSIKPFLLFQ